MSSRAGRTSKKTVRGEIPVRRSSGNVYEDLDIPESAEALAKSEIAARIAMIVEKRGLTQVLAAEHLGISQADVSDLIRGKLKGFSTERLFRLVTALGQDVEIVLRGSLHARRAGRIRVVSESPLPIVADARSRK